MRSVGFVVTPDDRDWFDCCRRAWDLGSRLRRNLERTAGSAPTLERVLHDALAVYYFPGMWTWARSVVEPLVERSLNDAGFAHSAFDFVRAYARWAEAIDSFTPLRVETDIEVHIPDAAQNGAELAGPDGGPVLYRDRVDLVVSEPTDGGDLQWLVDHRLVDLQRGSWALPDQLALDERAMLSCWAWEYAYLVPIAGVQFNEVCVAPPEFRRSRIAYSAAEKFGAAHRLGASVAAMLAAPTSAEPTPRWEHCARCDFREPCITMNRGDDASALLAERYRPRAPDVLEPGRLGGQSWGLGRGAAPPQFD